MRLSWNEIRTRAAQFAKDWAGEGYEKGQTQLFYRDFFDVFNIPVRRVASFEEPVRNLGERRGYIDLFWKGVLLVEQKSVGRDLRKAKTQALDYFPGLKDTDLPRFILLSDFQTFELYDLDEDTALRFALTDLPKHVEKFGFILGVQKRSFKDQDPVNIKASELVGKLHDALEASGYIGDNLERFLVRIVFCLFADDTGIFEPRDIFLDLLETRTREDGSDLGGWIAQLFQVLDTPEDKRSAKLDDDLNRFPYINGDLFRDPLRIPAFDSEMRSRLIETCEFDWSGISPAIFGALFQSVMNKAERRAQGAHYTTEKNILKVIEPLFMDDLRAELEKLKVLKRGRRNALLAFQRRLAEMKFFDPACGCGNFLIITYRELREMEIEILRILRSHLEDERTLELDAAELSMINVDQFFGIEIGEFPARIAETALWMMDHIMNNRLSLEFGQTYVRIPLRKSPHILHADALETDWKRFLDPEECSFVFGNPPFVGAKMQSQKQREQVRRIANLGNSGGTLDFVAAWFLTAGRYVQRGTARIGFVATNSIAAGEQVAQLWPLLFGQCHLEISFAHRTFAWGSDARGKAHVHVVIVGLDRVDRARRVRRLFSYDDINGEPHESQHSSISAYLFDGSGLRNPHVVVRESAQPINCFPKLVIGSKPIDGGHYIFSDEEKADFVREEPGADQLLRPFIGSREFLQGGRRWILYLGEAAPEVLRTLPKVRERISAVREVREASKSPSTQALATTPHLYHVNVVPRTPFLVVPEVSSERREYIPIAWMEPPVIPSNKVRILLDATLWHFGILTSRMHMAWVRDICGRLKSDFQYGIGVVYNNFPVPDASDGSVKKIELLAQAVLDERSAHPAATLSDLYDQDLMPSDLRRAHSALDRGVDALYRRSGFASDRERVDHLLDLYEYLVTPLAPASVSEKRRGHRKGATE